MRMLYNKGGAFAPPIKIVMGFILLFTANLMAKGLPKSCHVDCSVGSGSANVKKPYTALCICCSNAPVAGPFLLTEEWYDKVSCFLEKSSNPLFLAPIYMGFNIKGKRSFYIFVVKKKDILVERALSEIDLRTLKLYDAIDNSISEETIDKAPDCIEELVIAFDRKSVGIEALLAKYKIKFPTMVNLILTGYLKDGTPFIIGVTFWLGEPGQKLP